MQGGSVTKRVEEFGRHALGSPVPILERHAGGRIPQGGDVGMVHEPEAAALELLSQLQQISLEYIGLRVHQGIEAEDEIHGLVVDHRQ
jgi:hypothetical protein